jgi:hypothetical protein
MRPFVKTNKMNVKVTTDVWPIFIQSIFCKVDLAFRTAIFSFSTSIFNPLASVRNRANILGTELDIYIR